MEIIRNVQIGTSPVPRNQRAAFMATRYFLPHMQFYETRHGLLYKNPILTYFRTPPTVLISKFTRMSRIDDVNAPTFNFHAKANYSAL